MQKESDSSSARIFIAIPIREDVRKSIGGFAASVKQSVAGARWVATDNYHVTLVFLGDVQAAMIKKISRILDSIPSQNFEIGFQTVGVFPNVGKARVLWVGVEKGFEECAVISSFLVAALKKEGITVDAKPFKGHLTIARFNTPVRISNAVLVANSKFPFMPADRVVLFKSQLSPDGPTYTELYSTKLS